jgi:hypothetical protein
MCSVTASGLYVHWKKRQFRESDGQGLSGYWPGILRDLNRR